MFAVVAGLPVAVHIEAGTGVETSPTPSGAPRTYEHYVGFQGLNYVYHQLNMIAEGLFERYDLKVVWADHAARVEHRQRFAGYVPRVLTPAQRAASDRATRRCGASFT